jgi:hypothetical protein
VSGSPVYDASAGKMGMATCSFHTEIEEQMGVSYQKGWVRLRGAKWHGNFRRTELDPVTEQTKAVAKSTKMAGYDTNHDTNIQPVTSRPI